MSESGKGKEGVGTGFVFFFRFFLHGKDVVSGGGVGMEWSGGSLVRALERSEKGMEGMEGMEVNGGMDGGGEKDEEMGEVLSGGKNRFGSFLFCVTVEIRSLLASQLTALPLSRDREEGISAAGPWTRLGRREHFPAQQWRCSRLRCG